MTSKTRLAKLEVAVKAMQARRAAGNRHPGIRPDADLSVSEEQAAAVMDILYRVGGNACIANSLENRYHPDPELAAHLESLGLVRVDGWWTDPEDDGSWAA